MPTAVVTGSSSGIGQSTALEFARRGFDLILHTRRNLEGLQFTCRQAAQLNPNITIHCAACDFSVAQACSQFVKFAFSSAGLELTAWVNNAGVDVLTGSLAQADFETKLQRLWEVDVLATIRLSRLVGREFLNQSANLPPSIVNIGWDQAEQGMEGDAGEMFCPIKSAVQSFSRSLARTLAPRVRVNCVAPGWIRTSWGEKAPDYWEQRAKNECLLGRWGEPSEVAQTIVWLASDASFVNGQVIAVNGGFSPKGAQDPNEDSQNESSNLE